MKRSKIIAIGLVCLLFGTILSALATRTITDTSDIWTGTIVWQGNIDFESGSYFNLSKKIWTSTGRVYNATGANLQTAIYNLNNQTGWVDGGNSNISISSTIKVTNNLELRNCNLFLASAANATMIENHDQTNGNKNIYIHHCFLDGNGANQPVWWQSNADEHAFAHVILLNRCNNVVLDNLNITDSQSSGIWVDECRNVTTTNCRVYNAGVGYEASSYLHWFCKGIIYDHTNNSVISDCIVDTSYNGGIVVEAIYNIAPSVYCYDVTVSNCVVRNCEYGYYIEAAKRIVVDGCVAENMRKYKVYHGACGFYMASTVYDSIFSDCIVSDVGTTNSSYGAGFGINGYNNTLDDCTVLNSEKYGVLLSGRNMRFNNVNIRYTDSVGMYLETYNTSVIGGSIIHTGGRGLVYYEIGGIDNKKGIISGVMFNNNVDNAIYTTSTNLTIEGNSIDISTGYGIQVSAPYCQVNNNHIGRTVNDGIRLDNGNCTASNNIIFACGDGIDIRSQNNSIMGNIIRACTNGIDEGAGAGFNMFIGNICKGNTADYDINTANYKPYPQANFSMLNFGTWT